MAIPQIKNQFPHSRKIHIFLSPYMVITYYVTTPEISSDVRRIG